MMMMVMMIIKLEKQHKAADTYTLYIRFLILSVAVLYIFETKRNCFCYNICYIPNVNLTIIAGDDYIFSSFFLLWFFRG